MPDDVVVSVHFNSAGIAGVGQQRVAIIEAAGKRHRTNRAAGGEHPDDLIVARDFNRPVVVFVGDEDVAIFEQLGGVRAVELVCGVGV